MGVSIIFGILSIVVFTVATVMLINGKALDLVPGYSEMSKKEKENLDKKKFGRKLGIPMAVVDIVMIVLLSISFFSDSETLKSYAGYGMLVVLFVSLIIRDFTKFTDNGKRR
ncbi:MULTISPECIES: DUF3784 domain-containing protein [Sellimonas]|uniref:DUF3784 domain-containing protein n=1 Tax=Sellimonas caecigallum TaxID=2592333 RepID=A0ABS7L8X6_9FIRM|nr:DUF3784 domain-containing protein [Sellimonas caecigallum]MBY0759520.1 DUF3784 domain-containing protein [Sellimonas caecigallum]OUP00683.1 hypothetical protein B5F37_10160 [Drancourtella sp. An210]OUP63531.1 hypothetical protein B5F13_10220 [Drancourtella sp. An177]